MAKVLKPSQAPSASAASASTAKPSFTIHLPPTPKNAGTGKGASKTPGAGAPASRGSQGRRSQRSRSRGASAGANANAQASIASTSRALQSLTGDEVTEDDGAAEADMLLQGVLGLSEAPSIFEQGQPRRRPPTASPMPPDDPTELARARPTTKGLEPVVTISPVAVQTRNREEPAARPTRRPEPTSTTVDGTAISSGMTRQDGSRSSNREVNTTITASPSHPPVAAVQKIVRKRGRPSKAAKEAQAAMEAAARQAAEGQQPAGKLSGSAPASRAAEAPTRRSASAQSAPTAPPPAVALTSRSREPAPTTEAPPSRSRPSRSPASRTVAAPAAVPAAERAGAEGSTAVEPVKRKRGRPRKTLPTDSAPRQPEPVPEPAVAAAPHEREDVEARAQTPVEDATQVEVEAAPEPEPEPELELDPALDTGDVVEEEEADLPTRKARGKSERKRKVADTNEARDEDEHRQLDTDEGAEEEEAAVRAKDKRPSKRVVAPSIPVSSKRRRVETSADAPVKAKTPSKARKSRPAKSRVEDEDGEVARVKFRIDRLTDPASVHVPRKRRRSDRHKDADEGDEDDAGDEDGTPSFLRLRKRARSQLSAPDVAWTALRQVIQSVAVEASTNASSAASKTLSRILDVCRSKLLEFSDLGTVHSAYHHQLSSLRKRTKFLRGELLDLGQERRKIAVEMEEAEEGWKKGKKEREEMRALHEWVTALEGVKHEWLEPDENGAGDRAREPLVSPLQSLAKRKLTMRLPG